MLPTILLSIMISDPSGAVAPVHPKLRAYAAERETEFDRIPEVRKAALAKLARFIEDRRSDEAPARLLFICTHNSRRSHMAEHWARAAAAMKGLSGIETFSGGTEATAFNPRSVAALRRSGFEIEPVEGTGADNPVYRVRHGQGEGVRAFSKVYSQAPNPKEDFAAVMTCSSADESCPYVIGAAARVPTPYEDPKVSDGTLEEAETYDERVAQIAREMLYLMSLVDA